MSKRKARGLLQGEPDVVGKVKLRRAYWRGADRELESLGYLKARRCKRGGTPSYVVVRTLPGKAAFDEEVRAELFTKPLGAWYEDAMEEANSLCEEMEEWHENMEQVDGLNNSDKFCEVEAAAGELRAFVDELPDDPPDVVLSIHVAVDPAKLPISASWRRKRRRTGRYSRAAETAAILEACRGMAEVVWEQKIEDGTCASEEFGKLNEFIDACITAARGLEDVEFPGMF